MSSMLVSVQHGQICWGGHSGTVTVCSESKLHHCWVYYICFLLLALHWHYSCTASIMLYNPHCSHWGHTIVPAWYTVRDLTSLWNKSTEQTLANPYRALKQRCANVKDVQPTALRQMPGSTWSKHMCVASLSAAVTVGGKVKGMKCLGSNRAWLKQSPWPGQEANFMQLTREDEGGEKASWTRSTQQPNCTTLPSVHNSQSTDEKDKEWYHT